MAGTKLRVVCLVAEKGRQCLGYLHLVAGRFQAFQQGGHWQGIATFGLGREGCATGHHELAFREGQGLLRCQLQSRHKAFHKLRQKVQGPAKKGHVSAYGLAAGKAADGLLHNCLQNGNGKILARNTLVQKGDHVRLGKDATARGYGVYGLGP